MRYPQPTAEAIQAEFERLKPRYEAFMKANKATPYEAQLREWATENLREQIILETEAAKQNLSVNDLLKSIADATPRVTVDEARQLYKSKPEHFLMPERVHARHIVIHRENTPSATEATTTLLNLRAKIRSGAMTWEEAVAAVSSCPDNSDLGFFRRGVMVEPFEEAAFAAEEGSITDVVETQLGWHIIHVVAHLPEEPALFEEVKADILSTLQTQRDREAIEAYVDERKQCFK